MSSASISDLKARLSKYLREVRRGGEVEVLDRGVPVARIVRIERSAAAASERRRRLIDAGVVRAGSGRVEVALSKEPVDIEGGLQSALDAVREDRL